LVALPGDWPPGRRAGRPRLHARKRHCRHRKCL